MALVQALQIFALLFMVGYQLVEHLVEHLQHLVLLFWALLSSTQLAYPF